MFTLLQKEINSFLNSLIGYIVMVVFISLIGLFMWLFSGSFNVLDSGYANMDSLFVIAPWVFLFLVPAITMRSFSEEFRAGTIELLATKPLTSAQIVLAKFFAGWVLVLIALIPTVLYYYTLGALGLPAWNLDNGAILGSYIGLALLAAVYVSIGIFASSLTVNQIVAFILAVFLTFTLFTGFDFIADLNIFGEGDLIVRQLGISEHYLSISRGVVDSRDVVYFGSIVVLFVFLTIQKLEGKK